MPTHPLPIDSPTHSQTEDAPNTSHLPVEPEFEPPAVPKPEDPQSPATGA